MFNTKKRPSCNLSGKSQERGRLTALIPINVFLSKQNYTTWLVACDHDDAKIRNFIVKNITEIQDKSAIKIDSVLAENKYLADEDGNKLRFLGKNVKEINKKVNEEINNCLADLIDKSNIPRSPAFLLVRSWDFMNEGKASCGCLMSESSLLILNHGGKQIQKPLSAIAKEYNVDICTIKRRAKQPDMTLSEIGHGLNGRKENSISGSREKSKLVLRLISKLKSQLSEKEAFQKISQQARLDVSHDFILRKRFSATERYSLRDLAETDILDCSHEQVRKLESEMLDKIIEAFGLKKSHEKMEKSESEIDKQECDSKIPSTLQESDLTIPTIKVKELGFSTINSIEDATIKVKESGFFTINSIEDGREKIDTSIVRRRGQPEFRKQLLIAYNNKCAVTGCDAIQALEAAHIYPYKGDKTDRIDNGLLLRADIHTLFDRYQITIHPKTKEVCLSPELQNSSYKDLNSKVINLPEDDNSWPSIYALELHYDQCKWTKQIDNGRSL